MLHCIIFWSRRDAWCSLSLTTLKLLISRRNFLVQWEHTMFHISHHKNIMTFAQNLVNTMARWSMKMSPTSISLYLVSLRGVLVSRLLGLHSCHHYAFSEQW
uniref:Uncharacterized protein n=1 Tax=Opuntia streptacantha TaxID=393608 RepID=A0A7C9ACQ0_OPUST